MNYFLRKFSALKELLYFTNWPILVVGRLPIFSNRFALYQKDSISFITDYQGGDSTGARHLLASNLYKDFIEQIASKGQKITTLLDVGANNGGFILHLINRFPRQLRKIVAVEFNYRTYLRLHFNVLYNTDTDTDVKLINAAAAGSDGWLQSEDNYGSTGNSIYSTSNTVKSIRLPTITFDSLFENNVKTNSIDLCKIDIEGAEYEFLSPRSSQHLNKVKYLLIEIHNNRSDNPQQLIENIISRGFKTLIAGNIISPEVFLFENTSLN